MKRTLRNKRRDILEDVPKPTAKEKFFKSIEEDVERSQSQIIPRFEAANPNQKTALAMLKEGRSVVFLCGSAGVGKSMLAAYHAACQLKQKKIDKIYLVRPAVAVGKSIGLLPGDIDMKMAPYFAQTLAHLEKFMGKGYLSYCLEKKTVEMFPLEFVRGVSIENSVCLVEECQNLTHSEFEMMLTRLGEGASLIFTGDFKQNDLKGASGLDSTIKLFERMLEDTPEYMLDEDLEALDNLVGVVHFTPDDVVRSGLTRAFVKMYYNN